MVRRRLPVPPASVLCLTNVRQPVQKRTRSYNDGPRSHRPSIAQHHPGRPPRLAVRQLQRRHFRLQNAKIRLRLQRLAHPQSVLLLIALCPRRPHRRPPARVQQPELDPGRVGDLAHHPAQRVHFPHQVPLGDSPDRRIARHLRHQVGIHRRHRGTQPHARTRPRRLAAGMPRAHHDHVVICRICHLYQFYAHGGAACAR